MRRPTPQQGRAKPAAPRRVAQDAESSSTAVVADSPDPPAQPKYGNLAFDTHGKSYDIAELRAAPGVDDETADHQLLAVHLQGKMQALYSTLEAAGADKAD